MSRQKYRKRKFRFCGDCDCPDWVLAEIHSSLGVLSSVKLKILTNLVLKSLPGDEIPEEKLKTFISNKNDVKSIKAAMACIRFLLINACRFQTSETIFATELQQLGLPSENSVAIARVFNEQNDVIQQYLNENNITVNELTDISYEIPADAIDCASISFKLRNELVNGVETNVTHQVNIQKADLKILLNEMKTVRSIMDELQ